MIQWRDAGQDWSVPSHRLAFHGVAMKGSTVAMLEYTVLQIAVRSPVGRSGLPGPILYLHVQVL